MPNAKASEKANGKTNGKTSGKTSMKASSGAATHSKPATKKALQVRKMKSGNVRLNPKVLIRIHDLMVKSRILEERLIQMFKQNDGFFWIGGPGEEAFNVSLGLQVKRGSGPQFDFLHLHYRSSAIILSMGAEPIDALRQMKNTATDPYSGGRNFSNHYSIKKWNVIPIASTIETQYQTSIGTAIAQRRHGGEGISIANGGDAGSAEGDFASCLIWASRPGNELPILIIVTNNEIGISTTYETQHGEKNIADRGKAFGIKTMIINGNDAEESYLAIQDAMAYIRKERKPVLLEARVSRLYGHSSASGANFHGEEVDCLVDLEKRLEEEGLMSRKEMDNIREKYNEDIREMANVVKKEPQPDPNSIFDYTYHNQKGKYW